MTFGYKPPVIQLLDITPIKDEMKEKM